MVMGDKEAGEDRALGALRSLGGVARFPARVKCALLAWNALDTALARSAENRHQVAYDGQSLKDLHLHQLEIGVRS